MMEMLNALTNGIGRELGADIRKAYYAISRIVQKDEEFLANSEEIQLFLDDVLTLSIYNQVVIVPMNGAISFRDGGSDFGLRSIRMAGKDYGSEQFNEIEKITRQFYAIVSRYSLDIESLVYSSKREFLKHWTAFYAEYR